MNVVMLTGNICKDNELRVTTSNINVLQNTIAVRNDYKNKEGEYDSQFINFVAYRNNAEFLNKYTNKGSKILLEGRWNKRNYENKEGKKVYIDEMLVDRVELLGNKVPKPEEQKEENNQLAMDEIELNSDDLPF